MDMATLTAEIAAAERRVDHLKAELAKVSRYGKGTMSNGTVVRFTMRYSSWGTLYTYAAIKSANLWYPTGQFGAHNQRKPMTWAEMCDQWNMHDVCPADIQVMVPFHGPVEDF